jgi:hypothetical protein
MAETQLRYLTFKEVRERLKTHALRVTEIPVEHAISLPLPTKRWGGPGYALFASPALRRPGQPLEQGAPDRWWVIDAFTGRLLVYAMAKAIPIDEKSALTTVSIPPLAGSVEEARRGATRVEELLDRLSPDFFRGEAGDQTARGELKQALGTALPPALQLQHRALVPDFFAWLEFDSGHQAAAERP